MCGFVCGAGDQVGVILCGWSWQLVLQGFMCVELVIRWVGSCVGGTVHQVGVVFQFMDV